MMPCIFRWNESVLTLLHFYIHKVQPDLPNMPLHYRRRRGGGRGDALGVSMANRNPFVMRADVLLEQLMQPRSLADVATSARNLHRQLHTHLQNWLVTGRNGTVGWMVPKARTVVLQAPILPCITLH